MYDVIILGGGFGGVAAARTLEHYQNKVRLTLIDRNNFHLFTPSLYEVATSEEPQKNIAIPYSHIFNKSVSILTQEIAAIDPQSQLIRLKNGSTKHYDYAVIALGSEPAYYNIPGLQQYSIPLKKLEDAVTIKNMISKYYCNKGRENDKVRIVVGGGGFSGTELTAELTSYRSRLAKEHTLSIDCMEIIIIQGSDRLLKELDHKASAVAEERLLKGNVNIILGNHIKTVTKNYIETDKNNRYPYDIFIWTGGIQTNTTVRESGLPITQKGQLIVEDTLQVHGYPTVFAAGDNTSFIDKKTGELAPNVAEIAENQGKIAGENIYRVLTHRPLLPYTVIHTGYVVPLRDHYGIAEIGSLHITGILAWIIQQIILLRYLLSILPIHKAFNKWNKFETSLKKTM